MAKAVTLAQRVNERLDREDKRVIGMRMKEAGKYTDREIAEILGVTERTVRNWTRRVREGGVDGLKHRKGAGRPSSINLDRLRKALEKLADGLELTADSASEAIHGMFGVRFVMNYVRRLMHRFGMSPRLTRTKYEKASTQYARRKWQRENMPEIQRLLDEGFTVCAQDEAIITDRTTKNKRLWAGQPLRPVKVSNRKRKRTALYGLLADDGTQMFAQFPRFNSEYFLMFLKAAHRKYGRLAMVLDNAKPHTAGPVKEWVGGTGGDVRLIFLPPYTPEFNASEECWRQVRRNVQAGRHHTSIEELKREVAEFVRLRKFGLNIFRYMLRVYD